MQNLKEKIMSEALKLFSRKGYEAVSVRDIAQKLNISPGALYKPINLIWKAISVVSA
jgi:AcrR family transcriptional regulator